MTISPHPAPRHTVSEATNRLDVAGQPFVFFADAGTGRRCVLYHRYDGHYGLITPAQSPETPDASRREAVPLTLPADSRLGRTTVSIGVGGGNAG